MARLDADRCLVPPATRPGRGVQNTLAGFVERARVDLKRLLAPDAVAEVDLNPVQATADGAVALDALVVLTAGS